jgi:hypothetical protein
MPFAVFRCTVVDAGDDGNDSDVSGAGVVAALDAFFECLDNRCA